MKSADTLLPTQIQDRAAATASRLLALLAATLGGAALPWIVPRLNIQISRDCLLAELRLTGHLSTFFLGMPLHVVTAILSGLFALALWEIYGCARPRRRIIVTTAILNFVRHPAFLIFGFVTALLVAPLYTYSPSIAPPDDALIANFQLHRADFDRIHQSLQTEPALQYINAEGINYLAYGGPTVPGSTLDPTIPDHQDFAPRLRSVGIDSARLLTNNPDEITAVVWKTNSPRSYQFKGYIYSTSMLRPLYPSLDTRDHPIPTSYRHIEGNWYLYYDRLPE